MCVHKAPIDNPENEDANRISIPVANSIAAPIERTAPLFRRREINQHVTGSGEDYNN